MLLLTRITGKDESLLDDFFKKYETTIEVNGILITFSNITKEKLELIEGQLIIGSSPDKGSDVCLSVPRKHYVKTVD